MNEDTIYVYTDGAVRGKMHSGFIGYVVQDIASNVIAHNAKFNGHHVKSNQCEIDAAVYAVKQVSKEFADAKCIVLFTDSRSVLNAADSISQYAKSGVSVEIHWIPREYNAADAEVNTYAIRKHMHKSSRRLRWERVAQGIHK